MSIKPGTPCFVIRSESHPEWVGQVVTTMSHPTERFFHSRGGAIFYGLVVSIGSDRMPPAPGGTEWVLPPSWLRPITGPGAERAIEQERREKEAAR